mmetsp:Transcript_80368/g.120782  ORF Transcript_80368/g.120782 Transcript_80368/m.120782 type:complete len:385 (+) Transcript_80368:1497-2651(+)
MGKDLVCRPIFGPTRKTFVQPQVVPPLHGDEISKPLMRQLVTYNGAHALFLRIGGGDGIDQQIDVAIRYQTPVFHGAHGKFRNRHHIKFRQGVRNPKEIVVGIQSLDGTIQSVVTRVRSSSRRVDFDQDAIFGLRLHEIEFSDAKGDQIRGHFGGRQKGNFDAIASLQGFSSRLGHVAEAFQVIGDRQGDGEGGLGGGFVDAGKGAAGVQRFELRGGYDLFDAVGVFVSTAIKAGHLIVEATLVVNFQDDAARFGKRFGEDECDRRGFEIHADLLSVDRIAILRREFGSSKQQFLGVQSNLLGFVVGHDVRRGHVDLGNSIEYKRRQIGNDVQVVVHRGHVGRQQDTARTLFRLFQHAVLSVYFLSDGNQSIMIGNSTSYYTVL